MDPRGQKSIFGQKIESAIFRQKLAHLKSIFCLKFKKSHFGPKMDPGGQKSIFGQKIKNSNFRPKLAQKWSLEVSNQFLVEK